MQGEIEGEDLELYNAQFYAPSIKKIEDEVLKEGSFMVEDLEIFKDKVDSGDAKMDRLALAMAIRVIQESMLCHHIGEIEEEDLELYNAPFYAPFVKEIEDEVLREGSFMVEYLEIFKNKVGSGDAKKDGLALAMAIRVVQESMLCHHIGTEAIDRLFHIYIKLLDEIMQKEEIMAVYAIVVLRRSP